MVVGLQVAVDLLGGDELLVERADHHHGEFEPLGLVDRHHLDVPLGNGWSGSSYSLMPPSCNRRRKLLKRWNRRNSRFRWVTTV